MEINIYLNEDSWNEGNPQETLNGEIKIVNKSMVIETHEDGKAYRQFLSFDKIFAITCECRMSTYDREINLYFDLKSWSECNPKFSFQGALLEEECTPQYITVIAEKYKHYISKNRIFSCSYER
ncbi:MAG: hypothetical protein ACM3X7_06125 [Solirubrobacterales bacterium]